MSSDLLMSVTDDTFAAEVLQADVPVLVVSWAEWCGPCKMSEPMLEEVSRASEGRLRIVRMNAFRFPARSALRGDAQGPAGTNRNDRAKKPHSDEVMPFCVDPG